MGEVLGIWGLLYTGAGAGVTWEGAEEPRQPY
jgi:hypothetical protein